MGIFKNKREKTLMIFMCVAIYFVSYITRKNYSTIMEEMISSGWIAESVVALAISINSIAYGIGQLVSGYMGDKIKPYILSFAGLMVTALINFTVPFFDNPVVNIALWTVNGVAQAFMWPPLVRIMATYFDEADYKATCGFVSCGSGIATLLLYLCAPMIISSMGWKPYFILPGIIAVVFGVLWLLYFGKMGKRVSWQVENPSKQQENVKTRGTKLPATVFLILGMVMLGIVLQGILRDGMTDWMPTYINDTFNVGSGLAILSAVVLPVFHIISSNVTLTVTRKWIKNEIACACLFFIIATMGLSLLAAVGGGFIGTVGLFAIIVGCMHGVNAIFTAIVPRYFLKYGKVSLMSGLLNSCTYIGAAIATYGSSAISKHFGWGTTVIAWTMVAACGIVICLMSVKLWAKFKES